MFYLNEEHSNFRLSSSLKQASLQTSLIFWHTFNSFLGKWRQMISTISSISSGLSFEFEFSNTFNGFSGLGLTHLDFLAGGGVKSSVAVDISSDWLLTDLDSTKIAFSCCCYFFVAERVAWVGFLALNCVNLRSLGQDANQAARWNAKKGQLR